MGEGKEDLHASQLGKHFIKEWDACEDTLGFRLGSAVETRDRYAVK